MTKKEYVLKTLYALREIWSYAPALILMMEDQKINDNSILWLYDLLSKAIDEANNLILKEKLITTQRYIDRIRSMENQADNELWDIEKLLQNI